MGESMSAGHHLVACLHEAEARTSGLYFRKVIGQVIHGIESGYPLSTSMAKCPDVFDRSYVRAVWHGEVTANLDWAMLDLGAVKPGAPGGPSSQQSRTRRMTGP
jgi:type II secretory pathway component PulF